MLAIASGFEGPQVKGVIESWINWSVQSTAGMRLMVRENRTLTHAG